MSPIKPTVKVVGHRHGPADHRLRDFLTRAAQPFDWLEAGTPEAEKLLAEHNAAGAEPPVLIDDGTVTSASALPASSSPART